MSSLSSVLKYIWHHPLASKRKSFAIRRFINWQLGQRIFPSPVVYTLVENSVVVVQKGMTGATGNIYTGLLEFGEMAFVLHILREQDLFADIGANVGVYSILASVNAGAKSIAIEPVPHTFSYLMRNIRINDAADKIVPKQIGIGNERGEIFFTSDMDTVNHVLTEEEKASKVPAVKVAVHTIDETFEDVCPTLIKMDVEGFEWPALQGAKNIFKNHDLKAIIIEINGSGLRYGISDDDIHSFLVSNGFNPYEYNPFERSIKELQKYGPYNTIYIRDIEWARQRATSSRKYEIFGMKI